MVAELFMEKKLHLPEPTKFTIEESDHMIEEDDRIHKFLKYVLKKAEEYKFEDDYVINELKSQFAKIPQL